MVQEPFVHLLATFPVMLAPAAQYRMGDRATKIQDDGTIQYIMLHTLPLLIMNELVLSSPTNIENITTPAIDCLE